MRKKAEDCDLKDALFSAAVFGNALSHFIPKGTGIIIDLQEGRIDSHPEITKVIVHNRGTIIAVEDVTHRTNLKDGNLIQMINKDILKN